jgi:hypothetical protein
MDREELTAAAGMLGYTTIEGQGRCPQYVFIADRDHKDFRKHFTLLNAIAAPGEIVFGERAYGTVQHAFPGRLLVSDDQGQGTLIAHPYASEATLIQSLLDRDISVRFNDNDALIARQQCFGSYATPHIWEQYGLPQTPAGVQFSKYTRLRSNAMIEILRKQRRRSHQIVGEGHLDNHWLRMFSDKTFIVLSPRTPEA